MADKKRVGVGCGVMMLKNNKILLGKRHEDPDKADSEFHEEGTWTMPGGKLDSGETFEDCAKREVMEETGMKLNKVKVICVNNDKNEYAHFVTQIEESCRWVFFNGFWSVNLGQVMFLCNQVMLHQSVKRKFEDLRISDMYRGPLITYEIVAIFITHS